MGAEREPIAVDPNATPWPFPPSDGSCFDDDSAEARAIERILDRAEAQQPDRNRLQPSGVVR